MKKLLVVMTLLTVFAVASFSQSSTKMNKPYKNVEQNYALNEASDSYSFIFDITELDDAIFYSQFIKFSEASVSAVTSVPKLTVYQSYSYDNNTYINLDTSYFYATTTDSLVVIESTSVATGYPYLKLSLSGNDSISTTIDNVGMKYSF